MSTSAGRERFVSLYAHHDVCSSGFCASANVAIPPVQEDEHNKMLAEEEAERLADMEGGGATITANV